MKVHETKSVAVTGILLLPVIMFIDYVTGVEISTSILYLFPILIFSWHFGIRVSLLLSLTCSILWLFTDLYSDHHYSHYAIPFWNALVRFGFFSAAGFALSRLRQEMGKLELANIEIAKLAKVKTEFATTVSHELRTPLTAIKESLGIISDGSAGSLTDDQKDFLSTATRNVDRLARLINDVLNFQRVENGRDIPVIRDIDIRMIIRMVVKDFGPRAEKNGFKILTQLDDPLPNALIDTDKVTQVLTNYLDNALNYGGEGIITVRALKADQNFIRVSVSDEGQGIKEDDLPKLFQSFNRLSQKGGTHHQGTGLGLAISKKVIENMGGTVGVESVYDHGSTFFFTVKCSHDRA